MTQQLLHDDAPYDGEFEIDLDDLRQYDLRDHEDNNRLLVSFSSLQEALQIMKIGNILAGYARYSVVVTDSSQPSFSEAVHGTH